MKRILFWCTFPHLMNRSDYRTHTHRKRFLSSNFPSKTQKNWVFLRVSLKMLNLTSGFIRQSTFLFSYFCDKIWLNHFMANRPHLWLHHNCFFPKKVSNGKKYILSIIGGHLIKKKKFSSAQTTNVSLFEMPRLFFP